MDNPESIESKISVLLSALGGDFTRVKCTQCGEIEFLIPLDVPFDDTFFANYLCDKCDKSEARGAEVNPQL